MRRLAALGALALAGCFGGANPDGKYYCANQNGCLTGYVCYEAYCCKQDRVTGLCVDHPCIVNGTDVDRDGVPVCASDCNDNDSSVYPGAPEVCDGKDNNCNGQIDEGISIKMFRDGDGDGHGDPAKPVYLCDSQSTPGLASVGDDCADADARRYPGATEVCDGVDNDCNGEIDENTLSTWYLDGDGDGYGLTGSPLKSCTKPDAGYAALKDDCDDVSGFVHPNADEVCNGVDDNCDGATDEGVKVNAWPDLDDDGYGAKGSIPTPKCNAEVHEALNDLDCDDGDPGVNPGVTELCNGVDDNCDGLADEGVKQTFWPDRDSDSFGAKDGGQAACTPPLGFVPNSGDCDDDKSGVNPGAAEVCNGTDDNCNGLTDEGLKVTYFRDVDLDGFGDPGAPRVSCPPPATGYVENPLDCADGDATSWPGAPELCDGKDNNCDGVKDNAPACGPRLDQADQAVVWGAGYAAGNGAPAGCLANAAGVTALTPVRDTTTIASVAGNTASISVLDSSTRDFFAYTPATRNAGWKLSSQLLTFQLAGAATSWDSAFKQPLVLFCQSASVFAKYEPAATSVGTFSLFNLPLPSGAASGWTFVGNFSFAGSQVNWVEVHLNNGSAGDATMWLDDFRFNPQ